MQISTKISLKKLQLKHKMLKFQVVNPRAYKFAVSIFMVLILTFISTGYFLFNLSLNKPKVLQAEQTIQIRTYSLNGVITSIKGNEIRVKSVNFHNSDGVSNTNYQEVVFYVGETTNYEWVQIKSGKLTSTNATFTDLATHQTIAVYVSTDPTASARIQADQIEIIEL